MPSLKTVRKRITSVKATQKITRAMKMVAGARLNRAQQRIVALRPYAVKTQEILASATAEIRAQEKDAEYSADAIVKPVHPLLARRAQKKVLLIVLTSDRGLCGAFNTSICKAAERVWREKEAEGLEVSFATVGRKGKEYLNRRGGNVIRDFARLYDGLTIQKSRVVSDLIVPKFESAEFDGIFLIYNEFKSAITQTVVIEQLLPLPEVAAAATDESAVKPSFRFEPSETIVLQRLVPMYVELSIYRALLESQASEYGARMTAMDAATRNAKDMISRLTLIYNRARQAAITKELMEIVGGAEAMKD